MPEAPCADAGSPARVVALHDPEALGEAQPAGQPPGERAERLLVAGADHDEVVVAAPRGLVRAAQREPAVARADLGEAGVELHRRRLVGHAVDPHRPLAARRTVVDAGDEVPREQLAALGGPDPRAPGPRGVPGM